MIFVERAVQADGVNCALTSRRSWKSQIVKSNYAQLRWAWFGKRKK